MVGISEKDRDQRSITYPGPHGLSVTPGTINQTLVSWVNTLELTLSPSYSSAQLLSRYRPRAAVIAVTRSAQAARQVHLSRGVFPLLYREPPEAVWADDVDRRVQFGIESGEPCPLLPSLASCPDSKVLPVLTGPRVF
jgi:pyruvate kinase